MGKIIKYKYITERHYSFVTELQLPEFESEYLSIKPHKNGTKLTVQSGYAWDGCSPKWKVCDLEIGTPEGVTNWQTRKPITYRASLIHDALYQYKMQHNVSRAEADYIFLQVLLTEQFALARTYYLFVRLFGWYYGEWNNILPTNKTSYRTAITNYYLRTNKQLD